MCWESWGRTLTARKFDLVVLAACLALLGYFGWHAFYGPRGFERMKALEARVAGLEADHDGIVKERQLLDQRVGLMRPAAIDPDMVDELARAALEFARKEDFIILTGEGPTAR